MSVRILHGDCRDRLDEIEPESVHSVVTDPPYDLGFMGKDWDKDSAAMQPETWRKVYRAMRPGAFLVAFGGTRTYHRLVCAVEDGGFEIRDQLAWVYGSGFPKGTDKAKIPEAWQGWNTALKPAWEPIVLARKPMAGTLATNLEAHGCGAMNIAECRIDTEKNWPASRRYAPGQLAGSEGNLGGGHQETEHDGLGRWPANILHDGSDDVLAAFPDAPGQSGVVTGNEPTGNGFSGVVYGYGGTARRTPTEPRGDSGSAARFFYCAKADREDRNDGLHGMPQRIVGVWGGDEDDLSHGKGSTKPRGNHHPTVKPTDLMVWLCKLVTPPGGTMLDPFMGSGSTGRGALLGDFGFIGIEREAEYVEIAKHRIRAISPLFAHVA